MGCFAGSVIRAAHYQPLGCGFGFDFIPPLVGCFPRKSGVEGVMSLKTVSFTHLYTTSHWNHFPCATQIFPTSRDYAMNGFYHTSIPLFCPSAEYSLPRDPCARISSIRDSSFPLQFVPPTEKCRCVDLSFPDSPAGSPATIHWEAVPGSEWERVKYYNEVTIE